MKVLVAATIACLFVTSCATWSPEKKQQFWQDVAAGANSYNAGQARYRAEHPQINCTSNSVGETVYTHCN